MHEGEIELESRHEYTVVPLSELEGTLRLDSEFYSSKYFAANEIARQNAFEPLTKFVHISDGNHLSICNRFVENGVPYYRGQDLKSFFIEQSNPICIKVDDFNLPAMRRSHLRKGDILLSIVGTIGSISLVNSNQRATCSCKIAVLRPKDGVCSEAIAAFLRSSYGQIQIKRLTRGTIQMGLILDDLSRIAIPNYKMLNPYIELTIKKAFEYDNRSSKLYQQSEAQLLSELDFHPEAAPSGKISIRALSDSLARTDRLDSEYYLPKYDYLFASLKKLRTMPLGGVRGVANIRKSIDPKSQIYTDNGIPFVRVSDMSKFEILEPNIRIPFNSVPNIERLYPKEDTILFTKDGTVGTAYKLTSDATFVTSGALLHIDVKPGFDILPDYLALVLNSPIVKLQVDRCTNNAIIQHLKPSDVEKIQIPILKLAKQKEIADKIKTSFEFRRRAKELSANAIAAIETAVEKGEERAVRELKMKVDA